MNYTVIGQDILETINLNSSAIKLVVQKGFEETTQIFRHLLRTMVKLDKENETVATLLSSIWRCVTYFLDTAIDVNMREIENAVNNIKKDYQLKKEGMNDFIEAYLKKYEVKDQKVKLHFERLKQENMRIENVARDREHQLKLLSNPEGVKQYKNLLNNFSNYLLENQEEKQKQLNAMGQMLTMMKECKLEVPKQPYARYNSRHQISSSNLEKFMKAQDTISQSFFDKTPVAKSETLTYTTPGIKMTSFKKLASVEVPHDFEYSGEYKFVNL